jgi:lipocalin
MNRDFSINPAKFSLHSSVISGSYWVIAVGPIVDNQYTWAALSESQGKILHIVARDVEEFKSQYEARALKMAVNRGFTTTTNNPVATFQSATECNYPPLPDTV